MSGSPEDLGFDLAAASLRADRADLPRFVEALAARLEAALPTHCDVARRRRSLLSRQTQVERVRVDLGTRRFLLHWRRGELVAEVESAVHDMRRTTAAVPLDDWLAALHEALHGQASSSAEARAALERLLDS
jgi:hypothetical protein